MASAIDCFGKAVKAGLLTEEEVDFVRQRASSAKGMTRKEAELWAARDMLRDAMSELESIRHQIRGPGKPAEGKKVVFRSRNKEAALAAMVEEVQTVAANKIAREAGEGRTVAESQTTAEAELTEAIPSEGDAGQKRARTYEVMRQKVLGLIERNRQEIAAMQSERGMSEREMQQAGITSKPELHEIAREKTLSALGELNAVMKFLPPEVRGKAGGFYALAKSDSPLGKILTERLQRVSDELDALMKREYTSQIKSMLSKAEPKRGENRIQKSTLGPEVQATANVAIAAAELDADATALRLAEIEGALSQTDLDPESQIRLQEEWAIVNAFGDLKGRSIEQLATAYHWLKELTGEGRSKWREQELKRMEANRVKAEAITSGLPEVTDQGLSRLNTEDLRSMADSFILSHYSFSQFLNHVLPETAGFKEEWAQRARRADNAAHDLAIAAGDRLTAALQEAIGDKGRVKLAAAMWDLKRRDAKIQKGKSEIPMSKLEAIQFILSWDQPDVRPKMEKDGWTQESIDEMQALTSDKASQAILEFLRKEYSDTYKLLNPVYRRMFGMDMPRIQNYAPTRYIAGDNDTEISPFGGIVATSGITPGLLKTRVRHNAKMKQADALTVYWQHIGQASHWANYAELMREMRAVMGSPEVKLSIKQRYGEHVSRQVSNWIDSLSRQGTSKAAELGWISWVLDGLVSAKAISSLGFNLRSIAMQADSSMRSILALPMRRVVAAMRDRNFVKNIAAAWHSDTIQRRIMSGGSPEARYLFDQTNTKPSVLLELARASMMPMQLFDAGLTSLSSAVVYTDAYNQAIKGGMNEAQAEGLATDAMDDAVYRYSQPIGISSKSLLEVSGSSLRKMFMLFMSDPRLKTAYMAESIRGLATGKGDTGQHVRRILAIEAMALLSQTIANIYRDIFTDDDEEEIWTAEGFAKAALLAPLSGWFLLGTAADIAISKALEGRAFLPSRDPIIEAISRFERAGKNLEDAFDFDNPSEMLKEWDSIARSFVLAGAVSGPLAPATASLAVTINFLKPIIGMIENAKKEED